MGYDNLPKGEKSFDVKGSNWSNEKWFGILEQSRAKTKEAPQTETEKPKGRTEKEESTAEVERKKSWVGKEKEFEPWVASELSGLPIEG